MSVGLHFYILNTTDRNDSRALWVEREIVTDHPPVIGDLINLTGQTTDPTADSADEDEDAIEVSGSFRVVDRRWLPATFGSPAWPYGDRPTGNEWLDVMLVPAPEFFASGPAYAASTAPRATWGSAARCGPRIGGSTSPATPRTARRRATP